MWRWEVKDSQQAIWWAGMRSWVLCIWVGKYGWRKWSRRKLVVHNGIEMWGGVGPEVLQRGLGNGD